MVDLWSKQLEEYSKGRHGGDVGGVGWPWQHQTVETVLNIQPVNGGFGLDCLGSMFSTEIDLWTQLRLGETDEQRSNNWVYNDYSL